MVKQNVEALQHSGEAVLKGYEQWMALGQDNVDAVVASGQAMFKGVQAINREVASFTQAQFSAGVEAGQAIAKSKSVQEAIDLQASYARAATDKFLAELSKLIDMSAQVASDSLSPLQARASQAVERLKQPVAV
jgi:phasin family protein